MISEAQEACLSFESKSICFLIAIAAVAMLMLRYSILSENT